jgi:hypothetical protein
MRIGSLLTKVHKTIAYNHLSREAGRKQRREEKLTALLRTSFHVMLCPNCESR